MKKVLLLILVNCILLHSGILLTKKPLFAAETTVSATTSAELRLPAVHILPDNPLYFLKTIKEKVQLLVARNASSQANLLLGFSQKRLAEALKVAEKGKIHISEKLFKAFGKDIEAAQEKIAAAKAAGEQTYGLLVELQKTIAYQKSVIEKLGGQIDQGLVATSSAATRGRIEPSALGGLGIFDWIRGLFGKKEILSPLVK